MLYKFYLNRPIIVGPSIAVTRAMTSTLINSSLYSNLLSEKPT